jgi:hypothetical protein
LINRPASNDKNNSMPPPLRWPRTFLRDERGRGWNFVAARWRQPIRSARIGGR